MAKLDFDPKSLSADIGAFITMAVLVGIIMSILDFVYTSAQEMEIAELGENKERRFVKRP